MDFIEDRRKRRSLEFACEIMQLMAGYIPRKLEDDAYEFLARTSLKENLTIVSVPPECDQLDKLELEKRMLEVSMYRGEADKNDEQRNRA